MRVIVRFFAQVKAAAGRSRCELDLDDGAAVTDAVRAVAEGNPDLRRLLINERGEVGETVLLFVGEDSVSIHDNPPLRDGDVIDIMSPISGGRPEPAKEPRLARTPTPDR